ncbi:MAG TPA: hypothetical protein VGM26_12990 [Rhizomicrobium sp.]|jgi:hypothetical protein
MRLALMLLFSACAVLIPVGVQARPRDDAMVGAFRCAVVADSRQWLDCYYGAAQPVRAQLGLPPAMTGQTQLALSPPGGGTIRDEAVRDQVMTEAARCISANGDRVWLECYYSAARPIRVQLGLAVPALAAASPSVPTVAAQLPTGPPPMPRGRGMFTGFFTDPAPVVKNATMQSYEFGGDGGFVVTLADGQVWKQADEDPVYHRAHWREPASTLRVTVAPGAMNSFNLRVAGEEQFYKVHRIR